MDFESRPLFRGGSWGWAARYIRAAFRIALEPARREDNLGFRLCFRSGGAS